MKLSPRLQQRQSQSLAMTPQLVQSIKLLQLSSLELTEFISAELERNPLLELEPEPKDLSRRERQSESVVSNSEEFNPAERSSDATELVLTEMSVDAKSREDAFDASFENVYDSGNSRTENSSAFKESRLSSAASPVVNSSVHAAPEQYDQFARISSKESLGQSLETQIAYTFKSDHEREIARQIAHGLDDDGYFREDTKEAASRLSISHVVFTQMLETFQTFEPTGIGARNLPECLALQLKDKNRYDPAIAALLANLELLARREFDQLKKICKVGNDDLNEMIREIKALDPKPASQHEPELAEPVLPDVLVQQKPDGGWAIDLNPDALPKVLVNQDYHAELEQNVHSEEGKAFITDCLGNANWLVRSLDQRAQTILKVAVEIVKLQDKFFTDGVEYMRPLNLKTIADAIKMHESTVSRVTTNKYLTCSQGMFELKYFFSNSLPSSADGNEISTESVRHKIKQMIDAEPSNKILSDGAIVAGLRNCGIEIARRTVAKYRETMKIPSSVQRRREKTNHA